MQKHEFFAMGCNMSVISEDNSAGAACALAQAPAWFAEWEGCLSRFREDSELSMLNRFAGHWFTPSPTLWELLLCAREAVVCSAGLVTPTLARQLELAGYDRSFDELRSASGSQAQVAQTALAGAARPSSWDEIEFDDDNCAVRIPQSMRLDFGGIAKGWAAEKAAAQLAALGSVIVNAGGDIAVRGARTDGAAWPIGVTDPRAAGAPQIEVLMLADCGIATSGIDYRAWLAHGKQQHHIIDPRSGQPVDNEVLSVTVVAPDTIYAEVAAKTVFLLGVEIGLQWISARSELACAIVLRDGTVRQCDRFASLTWPAYWSRTQS